MARPRRFRTRRPPPPEPLADERVVEEGVRRRPRLPFELLWFWLALIGVAVLTIVVVVLLLQEDDEAPPRRAAQVVRMPALVGTDHVEAADTLEEAGLVVTTSPVDGPDPAGRVVEQAPEPGTRVPRGQEVSLSVSQGTGALAELPVPDATGPRARPARDLVRMAGFTVRTVYVEAPSREEVGEVVDQEPAAGVRALGLSQVTLFVGR